MSAAATIHALLRQRLGLDLPPVDAGLLRPAWLLRAERARWLDQELPLLVERLGPGAAALLEVVEAREGSTFLRRVPDLRPLDFTTPCGPARLQAEQVWLVPGDDKAERQGFAPCPERVRVEDGTLVLALAWRDLTSEELARVAHGRRVRPDRVAEWATGALLDAVADPRWRAGLEVPLAAAVRQFVSRRPVEWFVPPADPEPALRAFVRTLGALALAADLDWEAVRAAREAGVQILLGLHRLAWCEARLWARLPCVLEARWLVPVGRLDPALWPRLLACRALREAWEGLLGAAAPAWDLPALAARPSLVVDTALLDADLAAAVAATVAAGPHSLAVKGDARRALPLLATTEAGRVDCVFIDPPYNTGNAAFDYPDRHSPAAWRSTVRDALALARPLMADSAALFATIDDGSVQPLRALLEEVLGEENFVANCVWHKKYARQNDAAHFSVAHDHVLVAARDRKRWRPAPLRRTSRQDDRYANKDDDPRGPWQSVVYTCNKTAEQRPNLYYPLRHPQSGAEVWPERTRVWAYEQETHLQHVAQGRLWWGADGAAAKPRLKKFLGELGGGVVPETIWERELAGDNQEGVRELMDLGLPEAFVTPKPTRLVQLALRLGCPRDGTALDFFAGSGATAHAVLALNRADGGGRRFVVVESAAHFDSVLLPRVVRAMTAGRWSEGRPTLDHHLALPVAVLRLESYEEALDSLHTTDNGLELRYLLGDHLAACLSPVADPLAVPYAALSGRGRVRARVDILETFLRLMGVRLCELRTWWDGRRYVAARGERDGRRVLVVLRSTDAIDLDAEAQVLDTAGADEVWMNACTRVPGAMVLDDVLEARLSC